jgi:hypothetical protein
VHPPPAVFDDRERRIERGTLVAVESSDGQELACLVLAVGPETLKLVDPRGNVFLVPVALVRGGPPPAAPAGARLVSRVSHWADPREPLTQRFLADLQVRLLTTLTLSAANVEMREALAVIDDLLEE